MTSKFTWHEMPQPEHYTNGFFDNFEDAKSEGLSELEGGEFYVYEVCKMEPCLNHGDALVEKLIDDWCEDDAFFGDDEYLFTDTKKWKEPINELSEEFDRVIKIWAEKHNITTEFRCYENINETKIEGQPK